MSGAAIPDVNQPFTEGWVGGGAGKVQPLWQPAIPTALNWCQLPTTGYVPEVLWQAPEKTNKPSHQLPDESKGEAFGARKQKLTSSPIRTTVSLLAGVGCHFKGQCVWGRNEWIIWLTSWKEKYTYSLSQSLAFGQWCCQDRSGNEPKLLNLVLL